jgi:polyhydroxyalkanoate synthesis regulator phasin
MPSKKDKGQIQEFVRSQIEDAHKRFSTFEEDATRVLEGLITRGRESRKELEGLLAKVGDGNLNPLDSERVKQLNRRASKARNDLRKRLDHLQTRVVEAAGVASQSQVRDITRELSKLSKKVDSLVGKKPKAEPRN